MFGNIDIKTRPIRLAYLLDPNKGKQVREAIRLSSSLWGGSYFPIIPLHGRMPGTWREGPLKAPSARSVVLGYIEAFDPDILVQLSKEVPSYVTDLGLTIIKPEQVWQPFDQRRHLSPQFGLGMFELLEDIFEEYFKYKSKYPVKIVIPRLPTQYPLFWASLFGEVPPNLLPLLEKRFYDPLEVETVDFELAKLSQMMAGNVLFPRRITLQRLDSSSGADFRRNANVYFCDATKVEDVIDFWNLRAMGRQVVPVPRQFKEDPGLREIVINFLRAHRRPWPHDPKVCDYASMIRARNCTMDEMKEFGNSLGITREQGDPSNDPFYALQHWYPRVWDEWARDKDGAVPVDTFGEEESSIELSDARELKFRLKAVLPRFARKFSYHGAPRCANEIGFHFYGSEEYLAEVLPKSSGENVTRAISGLTSLRGDWRVGRNGLVKLVKYDLVETREIPAAETILFAWLKDRGWKPKLSPPGLLAKQIYRKCDGNLNFLRDKKLLGLLEHMNGGTVKRDGGLGAENKVTGQREMAVPEVRSRLESSSEGGGPYKYLLSKGIFKLGLRVQCPNCLRNSWYSLDEVNNALPCPKCQEIFRAVGNVDTATWCYRTAGPFSVANYADGAYAVLLTIEFFSEPHMYAVRMTPALSFTAEAPNKRMLEADFALLWEETLHGDKTEGIMLGECKTHSKFGEKDFQRMRYLAKTFPGAVLVFSTLRDSLTRKEIGGISRIAKAGRKYWKSERPINPVLILTGTELLNWSGPPYCWEESRKKKFDHINGLLGLCDATQQIYLNLPSWQKEWQEKWERRLQRRREKEGLEKDVQVTP